MKRTALLILIAALFFMLLSGCGEDSPVQETKEESPQNLVLKGPINYWDHGDQLTLSLSKAIQSCYSSVSIAATAISSKGDFEITVPPPPDSLLIDLKKVNLEGGDLRGTVEISDTTAKFLIGDLLLLDGERQWGGIDWSKSEPIDSAAGVWK
ncbi:MAG TPA: hypothetical protein VHO28_09345, partial [Ignavibacteriales bacterium]|nr:hypothetical protein [Ignavibacteriales bacterium]